MTTHRGGDELTVQHLFEGVLAHSADPILLARRDGTILRANPAACAALGRSEAELQRLGRAGITVPGPKLEAVLAQREQAKLSGELDFVRADGSTFPAELTSTLLPGEAVTLVIFRDVTAQRALQRSLEESEERFRTAFHTMPEAVTLSDPATGRFVAVNEGAQRMTGWSEAEMTGVPAEQLGLWPDNDRSAFVAQLRARGVVLDFASHMRRKDGALRDVLISSRPLRTSQGELLLTVTRDVTAQRTLERSLTESEERFRAAFQTLPDAITLTEPASGRFVAANEGAERVTGWSQAELLGHEAEALGLWADRDRQEFLARLRADGLLRDFATHLKRKDGRVVDVLLSARPLPTSRGTLLLTVSRDVSAQRAAERARDDFQEQLRQAQKMEAVGRLAGGVAHDFNNLLTVVMSCTESLREVLPPEDGPGREYLEELREAGERAKELTQQLLAFARRQVISPVPLDLGVLVGRAQKLLRRMLGEDVKLEVAGEPGLWPVCVDPAQMEQVLFNLAVNARDAMPQGGRLTLRTANRELDAAAAAGFLGARPGRHVCLTVEDDGCGIPASIQQRVFEPFFTTKEVGQGTGLGLATVHGIVTQSGGQVRLTSEVGKGTRFELLFPATEQAAKGPVPEASQVALGGTETVLLVEDEPSVRRVVAGSLRKAGYTVLVASGGEEALALAQGPHPPALVVCDVVMPGMNGKQVVAALRSLHPGLKVLFVSGYPHDTIATRGLLEPGVELLGKPFVAPVLLARVRALLDGTGR